MHRKSQKKSKNGFLDLRRTASRDRFLSLCKSITSMLVSLILAAITALCAPSSGHGFPSGNNPSSYACRPSTTTPIGASTGWCSGALHAQDLGAAPTVAHPRRHVQVDLQLSTTHPHGATVAAFPVAVAHPSLPPAASSWRTGKEGPRPKPSRLTLEQLFSILRTEIARYMADEPYVVRHLALAAVAPSASPSPS